VGNYQQNQNRQTEAPGFAPEPDYSSYNTQQNIEQER
jgi:hypothetical protein